MTQHFTIYTDGACENNPGPGGWGYVVVEDDEEIRFANGGEDSTTNNRMEILAVVEALASLPNKSVVTIYSDSKYVVNGAMQWMKNWKKNGWRTKDGGGVKNPELWQRMDEQMSRVQARLFWVKGHVGNKWNERADELSLMGLAAQKGVEYFPRQVTEFVCELPASAHPWTMTCYKNTIVLVNPDHPAMTLYARGLHTVKFKEVENA